MEVADAAAVGMDVEPAACGEPEIRVKGGAAEPPG